MKVKATDIAKRLNLSKATVSLALNNKPGVSQLTKEAVFRCAYEMERELSQKKMIRLILLDRGMNIVNGPSQKLLGEDCMAIFERESARMGCSFVINYVDLKTADIERVVREANGEDVAGVILHATEAREEELEPFFQVRKPMVIYDNDAGKRYHCVAIDNVAAVREAVDLLVLRGCRDIRYFAHTGEIYNLRQRRAGYRAGLRKNRLELWEDSIVTIGGGPEEIARNTVAWLKTHEMPDALILESYLVSIGVINALRELKVRVPRELSLIGIDELPRHFVQNEFQLTTVKVEHRERAKAVMMLLEKEMKGEISGKFKVYSNCEVVQGNSIR
ncbi:MAG: LacI family DNA-binding transcriptional regulator [Eubacteriales bacterium]|nr:LacI family DNA-binding transcriptional regulator [Eubacteriales bacterium]